MNKIQEIIIYNNKFSQKFKKLHNVDTIVWIY